MTRIVENQNRLVGLGEDLLQLRYRIFESALATAVNGTERTLFKANSIGRNTGCQTSRHGFLPAQFGRSTTFQYAGMRLVHDGAGFESASLREFVSACTVQITCCGLARHSGLTFNAHWRAICPANAFRFQCAILTSAFRP